MSKATPSAAVTASQEDPFGAGNLHEDPVLPQGPAPLPASFKRIWIQLEDNDDIPPTGQFIGVNGRSYMLRPGEPAAVPQELVDVLADSIMSVPVLDQYSNVLAYRDRLRFPYRFVAAPRDAVPA